MTQKYRYVGATGYAIPARALPGSRRLDGNDLYFPVKNRKTRVLPILRLSAIMSRAGLLR